MTTEKKTIRNHHLWKHKGFYTSLLLLFAFYQSGSWFVEHWFKKREARDSMQLQKQKFVERVAFEQVQLKIVDIFPEKSTSGAPENTIEQIFSETANSLFSSQQLSDKTKKQLEDFIEFKRKHKSVLLSISDMKQIDNGLIQLLNLYASLSIQQHPETRKKNIKTLKELFNFHKETALSVYAIDEDGYKKAFPLFYSVVSSTEDTIERAFIVEYQMKMNKNDYLLTVGGDELRKEYKRLSEGDLMPLFVARNVSLVNQYVENISEKGMKR